MGSLAMGMGPMGTINPSMSGINSYGPAGAMYRLSTQTNIVMIGYILLMLLNHLNIGQLIFGSDSKLSGNMRIWLFGTILLLTIVNCMLMLILKERRRPLTPYRSDPNIMPIMFTVFQIIILGITLTLYFMAEPSTSISKKINNVMIYTFINVSSILSTWGFGLSRCTIEDVSVMSPMNSLNPMSGTMMNGAMPIL